MITTNDVDGPLAYVLSLLVDLATGSDDPKLVQGVSDLLDRVTIQVSESLRVIVPRNTCQN